MELLSNEHPAAIDLDGYCALPEVDLTRVGTKSQCIEPVNTLPNELEEQEYREGFTSGLFQREQHRLSIRYQING